MKFELEFFEEFILQKHGETFSTSDQSVILEFPQKKQLIRDEVERIKKSLRSSLFSTESEERIELYIQQHQAHIIHLADQLSKCFNEAETIGIDQISEDHTRVNLCKILYKSLKDLLNYIETYFSKYFNQDAKIPYTYTIMESKEVADKLKLIQQIAEEKDVNALLLEIVLEPVRDFVVDSARREITYRKLMYLKHLIKKISVALFDETISNHNNEILNLMFYLNFNAYRFLTYSTGIITNAIQNLPSISEQLEYLSYWIKRINQQQVKPGFILKCNRPSILNQLGTWLAEELNFMEKKKQLTLLMPPADTFVDQDDFKINTTLSVPQLAFTIRLLKEAGIITTSNNLALMRFVSKHFTSIHSENISAESLRVKFYNPEKNTINSVQDLLALLISQTKKDLKSILEKLD